MSENGKVRMKLLKIMYIYTVIVPLLFGLGIILLPELMISMFGWPDQDPITFGITGSVYIAFGILAIFGLRDPIKFLPILLLQLFYKIVWFIGVIIPLLIIGEFPSYAILIAVIFLTYIIGDLIAIPFKLVFSISTQDE